jgi:hypothetical protein
VLIRGLGVGQLEALAGKMHRKALSELSTLEASGLIGMLPSIGAGTIDVAATLGKPLA